MFKRFLCLLLLSLGMTVPGGHCDDIPPVRYHLTARPWQPLAIPKSAYLDRIEGVVRFTVHHQNKDGAIIDPIIHREHQYATPYYAHALGTLLSAGRARDLQESGVRAMDWATRCFEQNHTNDHQWFFIWPLTASLELYKPHVAPEILATWRRRLATPLSPHKAVNNWVAYMMKGEWLRAQSGLIDKTDAVRAIEDAWAHGQQDRIAATPGNLYHDLTTDPDTLAVEVVGRGNLLALLLAGYDGPSAPAIRQAAETGSQTSILLQDPSGQMPCNGRTDNHLFGDVGNQLAFEVMAEREHQRGHDQLAGQYRHAALLTFRNLERWRRTDGEWAGSYFVTKNHFDPALRVGYQDASQYSNYNGSVMHHLAEAWLVRQSDIPEAPAPVEIGGYAFQLDKKYSAAFANAGGMQMQLNLRGDTKFAYSNYWTPLGVTRFGRVDWDTRLGPGDGARDGKSKLGVTFAPAFEENGQWIRLASVPDRYEGKFSVQFTHPLLVRCAVDYTPRKGQHGPSFRHEFTLTPDGVLATLTRTAGTERWGVTLPLLENDGAPLQTSIDQKNGLARTRFAQGGDEQNFIVLNDNVPLASEPVVRGPFGDLRPVRAEATGDRPLSIFIYPCSPGAPSAQTVRDSFRLTPAGFRSVLGTVEAQLYQGRTSAGGAGGRITLAGDNPPVTLSAPCGFVMQLAGGKVTKMEADHDVQARIQGRSVALHAFVPAEF